MAFFKKKHHEKPAEPQVQPAVEIKTQSLPEDDDAEIAAVILAAICAGGQASACNLIVRSIVRVPEQNTAWNRSTLLFSE